MMRSLWSGVTGLQAHQMAMDVEGNNIANVNTKGYKYARVSFADQISQTAKIATPPRGGSGGTNPRQIGLGTQGHAITKVFKQGSAENTDVNTDLAIQDDGFFIVSADGGESFRYTRNGEFKFDQQGNFVSNSGHIVQGWMRNPSTGLVDKTVPIQNIVIPTGLTTEAKASTYISLKANLDSGDSVGKNISYISPLDRYRGWFDRDNNKTMAPTIPPGLPTEEHNENSDTDYLFDKDQNIIEAGLDVSVLFNSEGRALNVREDQGVWVSLKDAIKEQTIVADASIAPATFTLNGKTIGIQTTVPASITGVNAQEYNAKKLADTINEYSSETGVVATASGAKLILKNDNRTGTTSASKNIVIGGDAAGIAALAAIGINNTPVHTAFKYTYSLSTNADTAATLGDGDARTFKTTEDLRQLLQVDANRNTIAIAPNDAKMEVTVNQYGQFQIKTEPDETKKPKLNLAITSYSDERTAVNDRITSMLQGLDGEISRTTETRISQSFYTTTNATTVDIYDTLGSKHSARIEYTKINITQQNGTEWRVKITVAEPGRLAHEKIREDNNDKNVVTGRARFDEKGALISFSPPNLFFTPNNGADTNQIIKLDMGTPRKHDGLTSHDADSSVSNSDTDGYAGGDLTTVNIDKAGSIVGSFSNGKRMELGQIAMAKFTNNEGLENVGGNTFIQTSNSGDPIIGTAGTGGRGAVKAGHLEMSNVDLSRSLTQLIVVQRGFQANSKTITTSDQMLNTLLQLKQ